MSVVCDIEVTPEDRFDGTWVGLLNCNMSVLCDIEVTPEDRFGCTWVGLLNSNMSVYNLLVHCIHRMHELKLPDTDTEITITVRY